MPIHHLAAAAPHLLPQLHVGVGEVPGLAVEVAVQRPSQERVCLGQVRRWGVPRRLAA